MEKQEETQSHLLETEAVFGRKGALLGNPARLKEILTLSLKQQ